MIAALVGWFVCALFASVAFNWTFYYLLGARDVPREILVDVLAARACAKARALADPREVRAHDRPARQRSQPASRRLTRGQPALRPAPHPGRRRTPVNYTMVAPVVPRDGSATPRVGSPSPPAKSRARLRDDLPRRAGRPRLVVPRRAALMKFDAYLASDFMWATLPRGTRRIQMFHGVGGKYGFDAPTDVDARLGPAVLRQRAAAAQLHRRGRASTPTARRSA